MLQNPQFLADFVIYTEETLNRKLDFFCVAFEIIVTLVDNVN